VQGIVLRTTAYRDKDSIIQILTNELGKISVFGRRNKTSRKQSASAIEPLDWGSIELTDKKGDLYELKFFKPLSSFPQIRNSLSKLSLASFCCECSDFLTTEENPDDLSIFNELLTVLKALVISKELKAELKASFIYTKFLLQHSGILAENSFNKASLKSFQQMIDLIQAHSERKLKTRDALNLLFKELKN
jgi:DNA repair protein RecO